MHFVLKSALRGLGGKPRFYAGTDESGQRKDTTDVQQALAFRLQLVAGKLVTDNQLPEEGQFEIVPFDYKLT
jgi:hypothetical protein